MKAPELYVQEIDLLQNSLRERVDRLNQCKKDIPKIRRKLKILMVIKTRPWEWGKRIVEIEEGAIVARGSIDAAIQDCIKLYEKLNESTTINKDDNGNDITITYAQMRQNQASSAMKDLFDAIRHIVEN